MAKTFTKPKFVEGQKIACYFNEVVTFGEVLFADESTVLVGTEYNTPHKDGVAQTALSMETYVRRETDGLFVSPASVGQRIPDVMIAHFEDMHEVNKWRYYSTPTKKLMRTLSNLYAVAVFLLVRK